MDCSNICRVFQHKVTALLQFCLATGSSVIGSMTFFFSQEGVCVSDILFCITKHGFTLVDTLLVKIVEYGVLKTQMHSMKNLWFRQNRFWVPCVSQVNGVFKVLWGEWGGVWIFSIGCNYTLFVAFLASLINKINSLQCWVAFYTIHPMLKNTQVLGSAAVVGNLKIVVGRLLYF